MPTPLLPRSADNTWRGPRLALWLFGLLVILKCVIGVNSILMGHTIAGTADGIPLDTYTPAGAQAVVSLFAVLGLSQLIIGLLCVLVLVRYRALVPFMFALLLLEYLGKKLVFHFLPIARTGTPPGHVVSLVILVLIVGGLALSLWKRPERA